MRMNTQKLNWVRLAAATMLPLTVLACNKSNFKGRSEIINPTITKEFTQDEYPVASSSYTQGHYGDPTDENFEQGEWGQLDILVVIDNSASMKEEQANLATKLGALLSHVERADWQIGIVTTDPTPYQSGVFRKKIDMIKKSETNAADRFAALIQGAGTAGSGLERHFVQAVNALKGEYSSAPWVRADSTVVVLFVSDEDNCAGDANNICTPAEQNESVTDYLSSIRTLGKDAKAYGIFWEPSTTCTSAYAEATQLAAAVAATGGKPGSICDGDYTTTLKAISQDVAQILKYEFDLAHAPDDGTLEILVDGKNWDKFTLEGQKVKFSEPPPFGSKVEVSYRHGREGELAKSFPLEKAPVADSIYVEVGGAKIAPGTYRWDDTLKKVVFDDAPGERAEVKFTYKENVALNNVYDIGPDVDVRTLSVLVNDQAVKDFVYDAKTGRLTINPPPAELAKIKISFKQVRGGSKK
jgi:hypothetical protein